MKLNLSRPLAFFDLETTGVNTESDRVVQISIHRLNVDGTSDTYTSLVNPLMPIPAGATEKHHITNATVAESPAFADIVEELHRFLFDSDLAGFNIQKFDVPVMEAEFKRCGKVFSIDSRIIVDVYQLFASKEQRDLTAAVKFYCGRVMEDAHNASIDVMETMNVLEAQIARYEIAPDPAGIVASYSDPNWATPDGQLIWKGEEVAINFGKHKGRLLKDIASERGYLDWILSKDFSSPVKRIVEMVKNKREVKRSTYVP